VQDKQTMQFVPPPLPDKQHFEDSLFYIRNYFKKNSTFCNPMRHRDFAMSYQAPKQGTYLRACDSLETSAFSPRDASVDVFLKYEKVILGGKMMVPRVISPRGPRYTVSLGRFIKPIEKKIYNLIDSLFEEVTVMKGMNEAQRGSVIEEKWRKYANPVAVGFDASRFDAHIHRYALEFEHYIYQTFYPGNKELRMLLRLQIINKCTMYAKEFSIKYQTTSRMSGDVNTSLGNVLIMCSLVHSFMKWKGFPASLVNDGDDCVLIFDSRHLHHMLDGAVDWFKDMGITMVFEEPVHEIEQIEFCQCQPIYTKEGYIMVRSPYKSIPKDSVSLVPLINKTIAERWFAAVGLGGMSKTGGIPILQSFYKSYVEAAAGAKPIGNVGDGDYIGRYGTKMERKFQDILPETRYSFWLAFGINPAEQEAVEAFYADINLGCEHSDEYRYSQLPL